MNSSGNSPSINSFTAGASKHNHEEWSESSFYIYLLAAYINKSRKPWEIAWNSDFQGGYVGVGGMVAISIYSDGAGVYG